MKKFRVRLAAVIFMLAIGGAWASSLLQSATGYIKTGSGEVSMDECDDIGTCANSGSFRCKATVGAGTVDLFQLNGALTFCDVTVNHTSNSPIN